LGLARHILRSTKYGAVDDREATIAKHVPYLRHVAEDMLKTKDGHHLMVIKIGGYCFQTADQAEIDMRLSARNTLMRAPSIRFSRSPSGTGILRTSPSS